MQFQSTLPVWGATFVRGDGGVNENISIHAPRVGSDVLSVFHHKVPKRFQSTLPVWGATAATLILPSLLQFQSTLPVWGATAIKKNTVFGYQISIHAPRVGSDLRAGAAEQAVRHFNPRSPCGERRFIKFEDIKFDKISIHAPRVGSDAQHQGEQA